MDDAAMPDLMARIPRRDVTRARICAAAREVFLAQGFAAATAEQIVLAAGMRRSTFYNHFKDKNEVLAAIADDYLEAVTEIVRRLPGPRPSRRQIDAWLGEFADFVLQEPAPTLLLVHFSTGRDVPRACLEFGRKLLKVFADQLPVFEEALEPGGDAALARATAVLRELGWALCDHVEHEGRGLSKKMLEVAGDLLEHFVKGWF